MYPRPRARGRRLELVPVQDLVDEIKRLRLDREPAGILSGAREWRHVRAQADFRKHATTWPGGEETFEGVPVIINRFATTPRVMATMSELEEALLGDQS